jgi:hypothetical protein
MGARCDPCLLVGVGERIQLDYYCVHWSLFGMGWVLNVEFVLPNGYIVACFRVTIMVGFSQLLMNAGS